MKVVILSEVEQFCSEHNFQMVGLDRLRDMAIDDDTTGRDRAFKEGYAKAHKVITETLAKEKP